MLTQVGAYDDDTLVSGLDELWDRRIIRERGSSAYDFTHDKIREVAYTGLQPARRRRLHLAVAKALEAENTADTGPVSGQIAAHYEAAGDDPVLVTEGHYLLGVTRFWRGEFQASRQHLERAIATYRPDNHRSHVLLFGQDPKVICLIRLGLTLWYLGLADQADRVAQEALQLGEALDHPLTLEYALTWSAWLACEQGKTERMSELAGTSAELAARCGLSWWAKWDDVWLGWAQATGGEPVAGARRIRDGLEGWATTGENLGCTYGLSLLAGAHALAAAPQRSLEAIHEALEATEHTGQRYLEAELHRLRGHTLRELGDTAQARRCVELALTVAREQGARLLELRAAVSLARHGGGTEPLQAACAAFDAGERLPEVIEARTIWNADIDKRPALIARCRGTADVAQFRHRHVVRVRSAPGRPDRAGRHGPAPDG